MTAHLSHGLLEGLERSETAAWGDFYRAASAESIERCGLQVSGPDGPLIAMASAADVLGLNRVVGLGMGKTVAAQDIRDLIDRYTAAGVPRFFVQLGPQAEGPDLTALLVQHGFRHYNNWVKLYRDASPPPEVATDLVVREIDRDAAADFGRIVADCFGWPEATAGWVADLVGRSGWLHYMAYDGTTPVATAALYIYHDYAWVDFATTLSEYRGRGAQGALLARRIEDARQQGCLYTVVETAEETPQKSAPSFRNMRRYGFEEAYVRPNYIYFTEPAPA